jgi:microcystin-dependent protein
MDAEMDGMATGLSTAICRDGQSTATARIPFAAGVSLSSGSAAAPSYNFISDADTGMYLSSSGTTTFASNGVSVLSVIPEGIFIAGLVSATGAIACASLGATGDVDAAVIKQGTYRLVPAGAIMAYAGATAPDGWLLCYGQSLSRATYADLFTAISTTYGAGDDPGNTFAAPDLRGRVVAGQDDMGGSSANRLTDQSGGLDGDTLGDTGGSETHTLITAELAGHTHTLAHVHTQQGTFGQAIISRDLTGIPSGPTDIMITPGTGATSGASAETTSSTGSGNAHNNVQPTIILNYIIKV